MEQNREKSSVQPLTVDDVNTGMLEMPPVRWTRLGSQGSVDNPGHESSIGANCGKLVNLIKELLLEGDEDGEFCPCLHFVACAFQPDHVTATRI